MKVQRLPPWIRRPLRTDNHFTNVHGLVNGLKLNTVCESARCPNRHECWNSGTATLMLLGEQCTRNCSFCAIHAGRPVGLDLDEPRRVAEATVQMGLKHVVLTSVARDDLEDGGSGIFAETIRRIREADPSLTIEVLTPDFEGREASLRKVLDAQPHVFNHNLETVKRLQGTIRPQGSYGRSLKVLNDTAEWYPEMAVKSGIMLGLGEEDGELTECLQDLYDAGCRILTIGQYLRPTLQHIEVHRYVEPKEFDALGEVARKIGFPAVSSGPFVRSSYHADEMYAAFLDHRVPA